MSYHYTHYTHYTPTFYEFADKRIHGVKQRMDIAAVCACTRTKVDDVFHEALWCTCRIEME